LWCEEKPLLAEAGRRFVTFWGSRNAKEPFLGAGEMLSLRIHGAMTEASVFSSCKTHAYHCRLPMRKRGETNFTLAKQPGRSKCVFDRFLLM